MDANELKELNRKELLELLLSMAKENERLKKKLSICEAELENRTIAVKESGSIAEAALKLSGIFEAAQEAADLYLENVRKGNIPDDACHSQGDDDETSEA